MGHSVCYFQCYVAHYKIWFSAMGCSEGAGRKEKEGHCTGGKADRNGRTGKAETVGWEKYQSTNF
jgi:hypothetical protein